MRPLPLHLRNPQDLHPTRWLAWVQRVTDILLRTATQEAIAERIGVSSDDIQRARKHDWSGDDPDPWREGAGRQGRSPRGFLHIVESLARALGHDCDLSRYLVYEEIRYLLEYDETQVSYHEWGAFVAAHRQYLGIPLRKVLHDTFSPRTLCRYVDQVGMNGDLAASIYAVQIKEQEKIYVQEVHP